MKYYEDPILGKGRAADVSGGTGGGGGTEYVFGSEFTVSGETVNVTALPQSSVVGLDDTLAGKQPTISSGATMDINITGTALAAVTATTATNATNATNATSATYLGGKTDSAIIGSAVASASANVSASIATPELVMSGVPAGTQTIVDINSLRGALTTGQAVDVTSEPDDFTTYATGTGGYRGSFTWTGSTLGFASFPKFAAGLKYLLIFDIISGSGGSVTPSGTWLDGTSTAKSFSPNVKTRFAMLFNSANACKVAILSNATPSIANLREYEVTACDSGAIAYIAALDNPDDVQDYYLVKRDMVSPWTYIIDMGDATMTTIAAGLAYQINATTGTHILTTDVCPAGYVGREATVRLFVGEEGTAAVQSPLVLGSPIIPNAINNCVVRYRDGEAVLTVNDTIGGYIVVATSGTSQGTLYYGLSTSGSTPYISISNELSGQGVDMGGAVTSGGKLVVGNGPTTILTGSASCTTKAVFTNMTLSSATIQGSTINLNGVAIPSDGAIVRSGGIMEITGSTVGGCNLVSGGIVAIGRNSVGYISGTSGTFTMSAGAIVDTTGNSNPTIVNPGTSVTFKAGTQTILYGSGANVTSASIEHDKDLNVADVRSDAGLYYTNVLGISGTCTMRNANLITSGAVWIPIYTSGTVLTLDNCSATGFWLTANNNRVGKLILSGNFTTTGARVVILNSYPEQGELELRDGTSVIIGPNLPAVSGWMNPVDKIVVGSNCTITSGGNTYSITSGTYTGSKTINKDGTIS